MPWKLASEILSAVGSVLVAGNGSSMAHCVLWTCCKAFGSQALLQRLRVGGSYQVSAEKT